MQHQLFAKFITISIFIESIGQSIVLEKEAAVCAELVEELTMAEDQTIVSIDMGGLIYQETTKTIPLPVVIDIPYEFEEELILGV